MKILCRQLFAAALVAAWWAESAAAGPKGSQKRGRHELVVAQWNVENLFDTEDDPDNKGDDSFLPGGWQGWTEVRYEIKLDHLAEVIAEMDADIVCLEEIENRRVLDDLTDRLATSHDVEYPYVVHREGPDHRGIDVAMLSMIPPTARRWLTPVKEQREILIAEFFPSASRLVILVNHWKSRWGPEKPATAMRIAQAKAARAEVTRLLTGDSNTALMVVGDFNDDVDGPSLRDALQSTSQMKDVLADESGLLLYNLHGTLAGPSWGTFFYGKDGTWSSFDSMSVSRSMIGAGGEEDRRRAWRVKEKAYEVFTPPYIRNEAGVPRAFRRVTDSKTGLRVYQHGYSDHFPVRVTLVLE